MQTSNWEQFRRNNECEKNGIFGTDMIGIGITRRLLDMVCDFFSRCQFQRNSSDMNDKMISENFRLLQFTYRTNAWNCSSGWTYESQHSQQWPRVNLLPTFFIFQCCPVAKRSMACVLVCLRKRGNQIAKQRCAPLPNHIVYRCSHETYALCECASVPGATFKQFVAFKCVPPVCCWPTQSTINHDYYFF